MPKDPFVYQRPNEAQVESITRIREACRELHTLILDLVPPGREQYAAIDRLREVSAWSNAAIVLDGPE